jgi:poly[(R)-3-hydroxyalkanoate] polymerase subunit PhaE
MDWSAQTNEMMNTWGEAQKRLWSGWMDWAQGAAAFGQGGQAFDPMQMFRTNADAWSGQQGGGPAQRLAGNILGSPEIMTRSMNLLMQAWKTVAPNVEKGAAWQPDLTKLLDQWRQEMVEMPKRMTSASGDFAQLSKSMFERWTPMTAPWLSMLNQATAGGHPGAGFMTGTSGLGQMAGMGEFLNMMQGGGQMSIGQMPRATVAREKMGKFLKVIDAMNDLQKKQSDYQKILSDGIATSVERTIEHLVKLSEKGEKVSSPRDLMRTWYSIADKTLLQRFNTPEFIKAQEDMTAALMTHKKVKRDALEVVYESMEIPTRSEIDEAYKDIHDLKREIRALKRALKDVTGKGTGAKGAKKPAAKEVEASGAASS